MTIRDYQSADYEVLRSILADAFGGVSIDEGIEREFGAIAGHDWRWRKARHFDDDLARPEAAVFVTEEDGQPVGLITTWIDREAGIGHIPNVAFRREYQGKGLGRRLIRHALEHFRGQGIFHAKIETLVQNDVGHHLYTSVGFREVARQIHFVADLRADGEGPHVP